jgi:hypothetical protein
MNFKKTLSLALIVSQAVTAVAAYASPTEQNTPEMKLISSMIALSGQSLSQAQLESRLSAELKQYDQSAPEEGRDERTEQALVKLGVYTPEQAHVFEVQSKGALASPEKLASLPQPMGAQFSECQQAIGVGALAGLGIIAGAENMTGNGWFIDGASTVVAVSSVFVLAAVFLGEYGSCEDGT